MIRVQPAKGDLVGRVHHHRDHMPLPHPHPHLKMLALVRNNLCPHHLRRISPRIVAVVLHHPLELRGARAGHKGRAAPIMQQRPRQRFAFRRRKLLDDQLASPQPRHIFRSKKARRRAVLLRKPSLHSRHIRMEIGNRSRRRFANRVARGAGSDHQHAACNEASQSEVRNPFHVSSLWRTPASGSMHGASPAHVCFSRCKSL